ncbi:SHOCT domain-containing protein [Streptomyces sp. NPDC001652]
MHYLARLAELKTRGDIGADEYDRAKEKLLA